jgi:hypothetical protein
MKKRKNPLANLAFTVSLIAVGQASFALQETPSVKLATACRYMGTGDNLRHYEPVGLTCTHSQSPGFINAIRRFQADNGKDVLLAVDPDQLTTSLIYAECVSCTDNAPQVETAYSASLQNATVSPFPLQNDGLHHSRNSLNGPVITVDLCPSHKPFEKRLIDALLASDLRRPIPLGIAITGLWMEKYAADLQALRDLERNGELDLIWINHSYTHPYSTKREIADNFLLSPGINFVDEVIGVEKRLIRSGLTPSVFFRFPGLVSNKAQITTLKGWGIIPIGSDAWLEKGEKPTNGSIILVHGNGNEPDGITRLLNKYLPDFKYVYSLEDAFGIDSQTLN